MKNKNESNRVIFLENGELKSGVVKYVKHNKEGSTFLIECDEDQIKYLIYTKNDESKNGENTHGK